MPRKIVGRWRGEAIHGGAGEYRYEHSDGTAVHVAQNPDGQGWMYAVDDTNGPGSTGPYVAVNGVPKSRAFERAYAYMEGYRPGPGGVSDSRGEGSVDPEFDFGGGL